MGEAVQPARAVRVCFVAPKSYPLFNPRAESVFGGAEVDLYYLGTELAKDERFEVSFVVADYGQAAEETLERCRLIRSVDFGRGAMGGAWRVWRALKRADADVYMIETASAGVPLAGLFCRLHGRAFVYRTAHRIDCDGTYLRQHPVVGRLYRRALRSAAIVYAQNDSDLEPLDRTIGVRAGVIPNGHRLGTRPSEADRTTVLWVARSEPFKRPRVFLHLARSMPDVHFTMVCQEASGDKGYESLVAEAEGLPNLRFVRRVPFGEVGEYFRRAKVFVNTSVAEGFPNTFIQACGAATPILSLAVNPDGFLDRFGCGVCCGDDVARLEASLRGMLTSPEAAEMGRRGRAYMEQTHDIARIAAGCKADFLYAARRGPAPRDIPVHVCFVSLDAYPVFRPTTVRSHGGAEVDVFMTASELARDSRFRITLVTGDFGQPEVETADRIVILRTADLAAARVRATWSIWRALRRADADVYFRKGASLVTVLVAAFCRLRGRRLVLRTSTTDECDGTYMRKHGLRGRLYRWALRMADAVFVQNPTDVEAIRHSAGVEAVCVRNGHRLAPPRDLPRDHVLWVGRNSPDKRPDLFVRLARELPDLRFVMVCNRGVTGAAFENPCLPNLEFHETVPFAEIDGLFERAKVLVNTSPSEGFPNTFIQAGRAATPVVSLEVDPGGVLASERWGVCAGGDWGRFVESVRRMADGDMAAGFGSNGRRYVFEHHDIVGIICEYKRVLAALAAH